MNDTIADRPVVVVYDSDAQTGVAYLRDVRGQTLEFYNAAKKGFEIRDRETNSMWDVRGRLVQGVHRETKLEFVPSFISEWYGWSAYHPESKLYRVEPQARLNQPSSGHLHSAHP